MKHFLGTTIVLLISLSVAAQPVRGYVSSDGQPVEAATITLHKEGRDVASTTTNANGMFQLMAKTTGTYELLVEHISMLTQRTIVNVATTGTSVEIKLSHSPHFLDPLEVKSIRASDKAPFTKTNISKAELEKTNLGQDLPFLLNQTPGVVVNADAGNGVGYTAMRIRGSDATRINMTINGIPYNDPESQGTFLVNLPDLASSITSIQVQRGVGTSSNGAGAFGATLNVSTNEFNPTAYGEINNSYGSFNTWKHTVKAGSGLISDHFTIDARLSQLTSDGFIDRASSHLGSFYLSGAYVDKKTSVRFNTFSGKEVTYQAWNGVPETMLPTHRTFNSAGTEKPGDPYDNETDNYNQDHYQLCVNHAISSRLALSTAFFLVKGEGYYEQYKAGAKYSSYGLPNPVINGVVVTNTDLVRQLWLRNNFYGQIFSLEYKTPKDVLTIGGGWNDYHGKHFGEIIWAQYAIDKNFHFYDLKGDKSDINSYAKWQRSIFKNVDAFADLQYRSVHYTTNGFRDNPGVRVDRRFNFINPKFGVSYHKNGWQYYASYAIGNKEPNRDDFEAGVKQQPTYETLRDVEAGIERKTLHYSWSASAYYMNYKNQLILTGQINDVGAYTRVNVPKSYRTGVELQGTLRVAKWLTAAANLALSKNKINSSDEYVDDYDLGGQKIIRHDNTDISFSPSVVAGSTLTIMPVKSMGIAFINKYVSRQYLDNTQDVNRSLKPFFVQDARVSYTIQHHLFSQLQLVGAVYNLFNRKYEPNGYTYSYIYNSAVTTENYYFPMAGTNYMLGVNIKL